ncbi:hypothetical protein ACIBG4_23835 [Nonomuraea sp. NPDC050383]|uniref:hypothetical protein n=1 Tax=Nonomuraea sp. NPDC050383 TaxID=3364362 RepID=UPI0037BB3C3F
MAEPLATGRPGVDPHECELDRFEKVQLAPVFGEERGRRNFVEVYDVLHPVQGMDSPRPWRTAPCLSRRRELGVLPAAVRVGAARARPHGRRARGGRAGPRLVRRTSGGTAP